MGIARDEAEKYFPTQYWPGMEPNGDYLGKECYIEGIQSCDIQDVYIQGRTAEPTEAEIKAAMEVFDLHAYSPSSSLPVDCSCGYIAVDMDDLRHHQAAQFLIAARKAVWR